MSGVFSLPTTAHLFSAKPANCRSYMRSGDCHCKQLLCLPRATENLAQALSQYRDSVTEAFPVLRQCLGAWLEVSGLEGPNQWKIYRSTERCQIALKDFFRTNAKWTVYSLSLFNGSHSLICARNTMRNIQRERDYPIYFAYHCIDRMVSVTS